MYINVKGFSDMDKRRAITKVTVCAVISDILKWIHSDGNYEVQLQRGFIGKDMSHFFIIVDELDALRDVENILHHFQISAIGNPTRYPIDILEIVYRNSNEARPGGLFIRVNGGEIPIVFNPNVLVLDTQAIEAVIGMIIDSNQTLIELIEKPGGKHAAKRSGK